MIFKLLILFTLLVNKIRSDHFRGGVISWKPVDPLTTFPVSNVNVLVTIRLFWKLSTFSPLCDSSDDITNSNLFGDSSYLVSKNGPSWSLGTQVNCYNYSETDQWSAGERTHTVSITTAYDVNAAFDSCCWIGGITSVSGSTSWSLNVKINLQPRTDTNKINSSPTTTMIPYVKLSLNCTNNRTIVIPVADSDNDTVKCRCSNDMCLSYLTIDKEKCIIYFNPVSSGFFAIEIQIEDFNSSTSTVAMSSVPLQFLVNVTTGSMYCCTDGTDSCRNYNYFLIKRTGNLAPNQNLKNEVDIEKGIFLGSYFLHYWTFGAKIKELKQ